MSAAQHESERAVADAAARAHVQIELDPAEWHWEDAAEDRHVDQRLDRDPVATSCLISAFLLSALVLAPALQTIAQHMH